MAIHGLTENEVQARRKQGLGNDINIGSGRSYWDIARANLFTLFNNILFIIGIALILIRAIWRDRLFERFLGLEER